MVVLGGGPAGCASALALSRLGVTGVLLVEAGSYEVPRVGETAPPAIHLLLERLGLWDGFLAQGHEPCLGSCSLWGSAEPGYNDFLLDPHGTGWHLDRRRFDAFLARAAEGAGVELWVRARFRGVERRAAGGFTLRLAGPAGPRTVHARYVVDATGSRSCFARAVGARHRRDDRLGYVAAFLDPPAGASMSRLTLLEAVDYGWWYAARLPEGRATAAVATDPDLLRQHGLHHEEAWLDHLRETRLVGEAMAGCRPSGGLVVRSAPSCRLDPCCGPGWLAAGDAASSYDPIASQGIYKALLEGLETADALARSLAGDEDGLSGYQAAVTERFEDYRANREVLYGGERRWPSAPFWARRRERAATGP